MLIIIVIKNNNVCGFFLESTCRIQMQSSCVFKVRKYCHSNQFDHDDVDGDIAIVDNHDNDDDVIDDFIVDNDKCDDEDYDDDVIVDMMMVMMMMMTKTMAIKAMTIMIVHHNS